MKKYKLIKKYPGSPELGTVQFSVNGLNSDIQKYPEFWEEIIEYPDYVKCIKDKWCSKNSYLNKIFKVSKPKDSAAYILGLCMCSSTSFKECFIPATKDE